MMTLSQPVITVDVPKATLIIGVDPGETSGVVCLIMMGVWDGPLCDVSALTWLSRDLDVAGKKPHTRRPFRPWLDALTHNREVFYRTILAVEQSAFNPYNLSPAYMEGYWAGLISEKLDLNTEDLFFFPPKQKRLVYTYPCAETFYGWYKESDDHVKSPHIRDAFAIALLAVNRLSIKSLEVLDCALDYYRQDN